eukprot:evm.model.scf_1092.1 EVM.evm.TU.scf_1092.1   scf_1092:13860-16478(+)
MTRSALVCAFLAALLVAAQATDFSGARRQLLQGGGSASASSSAGASSNDADGMAAASSNVVVTEGTGVAEAFASTEINEQSVAAVKEIWVRAREVIPENASCEDVRLGVDAEVMESVSAIAEVYASAFGTVTIDGTGEGCADAAASGDATATAYLQVIIDVAVELVFEGDEDKANESFAQAYGDLVTANVAQAWAEAFASGCASAEAGSSFILAEQNSFARAVASPIVIGFAWAEVGQSCGEEAFSESEIFGEITGDDDNVAEVDSTAIVEGMGTADATGDAGAGTMEVDPADVKVVDDKIANLKKCTGSQGVCCRTDEDICRCTLSSRE